MTLQPENGAPSFYTVPAFRPAGNALLYGLLLSLASFCVITLIFNYGITETLWSYETPTSNSGITDSLDQSSTNSPQIAIDKIVRVSLPDSILDSLTGAYFSQEQNRSYVITVDDHKIWLQIDRQPKLELVPVSADTLFAGEGFLVKFSANQSGQVDHLDVYSNGRHFIAERQ